MDDSVRCSHQRLTAPYAIFVLELLDLRLECHVVHSTAQLLDLNSISHKKSLSHSPGCLGPIHILLDWKWSLRVSCWNSYAQGAHAWFPQGAEQSLLVCLYYMSLSNRQICVSTPHKGSTELYGTIKKILQCTNVKSVMELVTLVISIDHISTSACDPSSTAARLLLAAAARTSSAILSRRACKANNALTAA